MQDPASRPSERAVADRLHPDNPSWSPALARVRPPASVRIVASALLILLPVLALAALFVPWQQSASATGEVIAYAPEERQQLVEAPVKGRIMKWFVQEGQAVVAGDPLVEIQDNDPNLFSRLQQQRDAALANQEAVEQQITSYSAKLVAERAGRELVIAEKNANLQESLQKRAGEASEAEIEQRNLIRIATLAAEGIESTRKLELAQFKAAKATAALEARDREIEAKRQARDKAAANADAKIASVQAELEAARGKLTDAQRKVLDIDVKIARQASQVVRAPRDGWVLKLHGGLGGGQLKAGDPVATLVPDTQSRAVELYIDGNDMPFVPDDAPVRLVFEGWPAVQFVGLPGTGQGTFEGKLAFVDASASNSKGAFRAVVVPKDPADWPSGERLRQGVRVKGFLLLGQVSLGYEIWRQINGFPPVPDVEKGEKTALPTNKKPRSPASLE
jgi:multidrug resistance efflux pump